MIVTARMRVLQHERLHLHLWSLLGGYCIIHGVFDQVSGVLEYGARSFIEYPPNVVTRLK